jgi:purine-nucleoside phosphorylase
MSTPDAQPAALSQPTTRHHAVAPIGVVLGSGWPYPQGFIQQQVLPLSAVYPNTATEPLQEVEGHQGKAVLGTVGQKPVWVLAGRRHMYQGYTAQQVTQSIRWLVQQQGCQHIILTNASGGIAPQLAPGAVVLITDQLNLTRQNPLCVPSPAHPVTFVDTTQLYHAGWQAAMHQHSPHPLANGVYAGVLGPSYETPAEVRMLATLGADVVGMSTVLEALQAHALKVSVLGLSVVANAAAGLQPNGGVLTHHEVLATVHQTQDRLAGVLRAGIDHAP